MFKDYKSIVIVILLFFLFRKKEDCLCDHDDDELKDLHTFIDENDFTAVDTVSSISTPCDGQSFYLFYGDEQWLFTANVNQRAAVYKIEINAFGNPKKVGLIPVYVPLTPQDYLLHCENYRSGKYSKPDFEADKELILNEFTERAFEQDPNKVTQYYAQ